MTVVHYLTAVAGGAALRDKIWVRPKERGSDETPARAYFFFGRTFDLVAGWQRICACAVPHPLCTLTLRRAC